MNKNFIAFILTHGRPDNVLTYDSLKKHGYTGEIYIIIDNEDKTADKYREKFGDKVIMFDKKAIAETFDEFDNFNDRRAIVYARNACFDIARQLGYKHFIQLDDDYTSFQYAINSKNEYTTKNTRIRDLDFHFNKLLEFFKSTDIKSIAMGQGGDFIGGRECSLFKKKLKRKAMNSFICSVDRPFTFIGRINEDVNTYTRKGSTGDLFFTTHMLRLEQKQTQSNSGGMTDIYLNNGTYIKSFYTVICQPSSVKIKMMGEKNNRLHHNINWKTTVPKILSEKYKKLK